MELFNDPNVDDLLSNIAEALDIPDHYYEDAIGAYEDISNHLAEEGSPLHGYSPTLYPQGSFRLGTVVRPHYKEDEYDIDLVCRLEIKKESTTQKELKKKIGDRLKARSDLELKLEELGRCWRLSYPQQFHLDVLPVIPDAENPDTGILLTDKDLRNWQKSDPIAYAEWFYKRMELIANEKRAAIAEARQADIEDVPEWQVRTPLQRVVQLLKRHRDIYFGKDFDDKPTSILITTLAAHAYQNQPVISQAISNVVRGMKNYIEKRNGCWWVENPVQKEENFADKWNTFPERKQKFDEWLAQAESAFTEATVTKSVKEASAHLTHSLGQSLVQEATAKLGATLQIPTVRSRRLQPPQVPDLAKTGHCKPLQWSQRLDYKASLKAGVYMKRYGTKQLWNLRDTGTIPKGKGIKFTLNTNTPLPFKVWWQVVNTGKEAAAAGGLRGGFHSEEDKGSTSKFVRWEETAYMGTHWVEAFVVKDNLCVARTGKKMIRVRS